MSKETTYLIEFKSGKRQKITVPSDWKVTFGPAAVGKSRTSPSDLKMPMALRFYENDKKQRAIFTDVKNFRDTSIKIETVKEWIDPDKHEEDLPQFPNDEEVFDI